MVSKKLNPQQLEFCAQYLIDLNATKAVIRAGYSRHTAKNQGHRLLSNPECQAEIQRRQVELQKQTKVTQERIILELARIAFANMADYYTIENDQVVVDLAKLSREDAAALQEIQVEDLPDGKQRVKVKLLDKRQPLVNLGNHIADMFSKRLELTGPDGAPIQTEQVGLSDTERIQRVLELLDTARARRDGQLANGGAADMAPDGGRG